MHIWAIDAPNEKYTRVQCTRCRYTTFFPAGTTYDICIRKLQARALPPCKNDAPLLKDMDETVVDVSGGGPMSSLQSNDVPLQIAPPIQFERVYVINLKRRPDRLAAFQARLHACNWPFKEPVVYPAIDGDKVGVPPEFTQGGGAYGCRMSHLHILQTCLMEDVESVLVLEDDADFRPDFHAAVIDFLNRVPDDWEGIMLGGQHHAPPIPFSEGVVRVRYAQRTHAYAARGRYLKALQTRWGNATVHIDWLMRDWQHQFVVYAPSRWLIGQAGGRSDIRGAEKPVEWWNAPTGQEPVIVLQAPREVMEQLRVLGWHTGMRRNKDTGIDVGLEGCFSEARPEDAKQRLRAWITSLQWECGGDGVFCTVWHPKATADLVRVAWDGPVHAVEAQTVDEAIAQLPEEMRAHSLLAASFRLPPVVLLRASRSVVEQLRSKGWHTGYWRNPETGIDRGLERIFKTQLSEEALVKEMQNWVRLLREEAVRDGKVLAAWHPQLTLKLLQRATTERVVEIEAASAENALEQLAKCK